MTLQIPTGACLSGNLGKRGGKAGSSCDSVKVPLDLTTHYMYSFTVSRFPKTTIVLDLTNTGGSKIHFSRYGSNFTRNSLNIQPVQKYKIFKYFHFFAFLVTLGKVIKFHTKRRAFRMFLQYVRVKTDLKIYILPVL